MKIDCSKKTAIKQLTAMTQWLSPMMTINSAYSFYNNQPLLGCACTIASVIFFFGIPHPDTKSDELRKELDKSFEKCPSRINQCPACFVLLHGCSYADAGKFKCNNCIYAADLPRFPENKVGD